jgi:type IV fimbrial biogenesis protein FimT
MSWATEQVSSATHLSPRAGRLLLLRLRPAGLPERLEHADVSHTRPHELPNKPLKEKLLSPSLKQKPSGFSLIELMIGIVVLAIAMAVGMPSYSQWIQNTHIRNAAESIQHGMQRARAEAVARNTNTTFVLGGGASWTVRQVSDGSVIESRPSSETSNNITVTVAPAASTTITLNNLGGVVVNADASATLRLLAIDSAVLAAADSRDLKITIGTGGTCSVDGAGCVGSVIRMCDPIATGTDPRACQ